MHYTADLSVLRLLEVLAGRYSHSRGHRHVQSLAGPFIRASVTQGKAVVVDVCKNKFLFGVTCF